MASFLKPFEGPIYGITRILTGLLFMEHGLQKVFGLFGGRPEQMPEPALWTAGLIELVGGGLVALGLFTRWAAFLCSGLMAVAYFTQHFPRHPLPLLNHGELAILYCWLFLLFASRGPGPWSMDAAMGRS